MSVDESELSYINPFNRHLKTEDFPLLEVIDKIVNNIPFAAIRLSHGFWEMVEKHFEFYFPDDELITYDSEMQDYYSKHASNRRYFLHKGYSIRLLYLLKETQPSSQFYFCVSDLAWPHGNEIEGTPKRPYAVAKLIKKLMHPELVLFNALWPKLEMLSGRLETFLQALRDKSIILVGPKLVKKFAKGVDLINAEFVYIDPKFARLDHDKTEVELADKLSKSKSQNPVVLFESGNLAAYWTLKLYQKFPQVTFIDLGQVLEIFSLDHLGKRNYGKLFRNDIIEFISNLGKSELICDTPKFTYPRPVLDKKIKGKIAFIEQKHVDETLVSKYLEDSANSNAWANNGPTVRKLKSFVSNLLNLDKNDMSASVTCNCTLSIKIAIQAAMYQEGRPLRWLTSSFGFLSSHLDELRDPTWLDCNKKGFLGFNQIQQQELSSYDGILITNVFGYSQDFSEYVDFAISNDKYLIIDNAAGLLSFSKRSYSPKVFEVVSFHHTKVFGFGEGGLVICHNNQSGTVEKLINFGVKLDNNHLRLGTNAKMSEVSAAYILQRLTTMDQWLHLYQMQAKRIDNIASRAGLQRLLRPIKKKVDVVGHLPFLVNTPHTLDDLANPHFVFRKYYRPLISTPNASDIFSRIVNIPCHPDMANISSSDLYSILKAFIS